jgi:hypothetical protein
MKGTVTGYHFSDIEGRPAGGHTLGNGFTIAWQNGPLGAPGSPDRKEPNGAFVEDVIQAALGRLQYYQNSGFACNENANAIDHLFHALACLESRTKRRTEANTEGTHAGN